MEDFESHYQVQRLGHAIRGEEFDLTLQEERARRITWGVFYALTLLGLGFWLVFPRYSVIAGFVNWLIHFRILLRIPCSLRLRKRLDDEWLKEVLSGEYPVVGLSYSTGAARQIWEYHRLPMTRLLVDSLIHGPLLWPMSVYEVWTLKR